MYESVTIPEQGHWEETTTKVEVEPVWDETISAQHRFCNTCGADLGVMAGGTEKLTMEFIIAHMEENDHDGWHTDMATIQVIHHDAIYEDQTTKTWIVDVPAHDEKKPASEAWDETIVDQTAYDEAVITGYKCSGCGATK